MPHIHTEPGQHDHTVTAYVVRTDTPEPQVLLHVHRKLGLLMPIGGHVELNETPWQAVAHELREESGYDLSQLQLLQPTDRIRALTGAVLHPAPVVSNTHDFFRDRPGEHFHSDTAYAFVASAPPAHPVAKGESTDLRWCTTSELAALKDTEIFENNRQIYTYILDTCVRDWDRVSPSAYA